MAVEDDNDVFDAADSSSLCFVDEFASNNSEDSLFKQREHKIVLNLM